MSIGNIARVFQGDAEPAPQQAPLSPEQREKYRRYFVDATTADERAAAEEQARAAAAAEYRNSFDGRTELYREGEPPGDLTVKDAGLTPARARLARYYAWVDQARAEHARLVEAKSRLLTALGAPEIATTDLEALKAADVSGLVSWAFDKAAGAFKIDEYRRAKAEERLKEATAAAETARAALGQVDADIKFQQAVVGILESRKDRFVQAVVLEATGPLATEYEETAARLTAILKQIGGAAHALHRRIGGVDQVLPSFGFANARLVVDEPEMRRASGRWTDLEKALRDDPRATLGGG